MATEARILVVDDELPVCKSIASALNDGTYKVEMALSGEEALKKDHENPYDIVIADLMMPGISGMDLLKALKQLRPEVMVIMITGYGTVESAIEQNGRDFAFGGRTIQFSFDKEINRVIVKVTSEESGEVIRQIPPEDYLQFVSRFRELLGVLFDETA